MKLADLDSTDRPVPPPDTRPGLNGANMRAPHEAVDGTGVEASDIARRIAAPLERVLQGKPDAIEAAITTLFAGGHMLLEDVPGVGKTTLALALAASIEATARRVQFTSDLLPTDVTGLSVYDQDSREFRFHPGPIFSNIAIADEVNRATPKTQSALLEAMSERAVTVDGTRHPLPELFVVVATQNPQDMEGTFALPEAQRDRFMTRISVGYPSETSEVAMLLSRGPSEPVASIRSVATVEDVVVAQRQVARVRLGEEVARYLVAIVAATRAHPSVSLGGSPRATLHLSRMAQSRAALRGRDFVSPDDVAAIAGAVLPHRLTLIGRFATVDDANAAAADVVAEIVASTRIR